ncbi:MFS siderochrome iron transporter 1 [Trichoderma asperellum]|uniref:MFS siderochrome iron transporter 1 n=1 Tax=Trichoderma asperellum TaxID=101201 RepID=A0A6V8QUY3_TRIAP|nr:MFS siderochrome iron transporter 1 [Trichoderma asperellum]
MVSWRFGLGRTESVDNYDGVLVPLEQAHLHSHSARVGRVEFEAQDESADDEDDVGSAKDDRGEGMLLMNAAEYTIEGLRAQMRQGKRGEWTDYEIKSKLINKAIQDIGMGRYNWQLFILCGFGWFADNLWLQGVSLTLPSLSAEFDIPEKTVRYTTSSCFVGLSLGSFLWGIGSDVFGRRIAFNMTLLITSIFGILAAYGRSWGAVCFLYAAFGFGVGGNLPVDGALFLEFLPDASSSLLTLLSVWWPIGQLVSSLAAWFFIAQWPVNLGWRYFIMTIGIITFAMFCIRFFIFYMFESPKFLLNKGRQNEAVAVVHGIAYRNGAKTWLTSEILDQVAAEEPEQSSHNAQRYSISSAPRSNLFKEKLKGFSGYPLFNAFLPQYLSHHNDDSQVEAMQDETSAISGTTYRNYAITSVMGIPGSLLAAYLVDHPSPFFGRRGTLASSTVISAVFLFVFAAYGTTSTTQLIFSCIEAFAQNIMYGVLYAFTPEIFPAPVRGAGTGVASFLNRLTGLMAPLIAANIPGDGSTTPIYMSAVLILAAFVAMCLIPIETRGAQRL